MIDITAADVAALAPEYATLAGTTAGALQIDTVIAYARTFVNETRWGEAKAKFGTILMTAHLLKTLSFGAEVGLDAGASGAVTMKKVGDLQVSYSVATVQGASVLDQLLLTTSYGRNFIMLRKTVLTTPLVT